MGLSKLLKKVNKAKSAVNSLKGISSKLNSLGYDSQTDKLGEEAVQALKLLTDSRKRADKLLDANKSAQKAGKKPPASKGVELMYPLNDTLSNYIVFSIRPRRKRAGKSGANLFSGDDGGTEIMLYVPEGLTSESKVSYSTKEVGRAARGLENIKKSESFIEGVGETVGVVMDAAGDMINKIASGMTGGVKNIREGRASNPMIETTFDKVDYRSFQFEYEFWPKSKDEADMVNDIIYTFRTAMLPDTYGGSFAKDTFLDGNDSAASGVENYFNFPNIFDVEYDGPIANVLDGFLPMVCDSCSVDNFNGGRVATFTGGQPVSTKMTLSFQEIKILSQESYQEIAGNAKGKASGLTSMDSLTDDSQKKNDKGPSFSDIPKG
jgi:hypothetical protein